METKTITTSRLTTACRVHGTPGARKLLLIHGNASSSAFYEPLMERLEGEFFMVAPDLRCFGGSDTLPVDATRGMRDFSDDIHELVEALGWDTFSILGWSMGGGVANPTIIARTLMQGSDSDHDGAALLHPGR